LVNFIVISKDGEWGKSEPFDDSVKMRVIRGTDFALVREGDWSTVPTRYLSRKHAELKSLIDNDILIETAGGSRDRPTGRTLFLKRGTIAAQELPVTCASFARFIRLDSTLVEPEFVYWWLQYLYETRQLLAFHTQHTGVARFQWTTCSHSIVPPLLDRSVQRKIATILSSYDDLIENNNRRIKLLEEMAKRIYREWFVDFRYPGHEGIPLVDSELGAIPERWTVAPLSSLTEVITRGVSPKYADASEQLVINQKCIRGRALDLAFARPHVTTVPPIKTVRVGDVLINSTGVGTLGRVAQVLFAPETQLAVDSHVTIVRPAPAIANPDFLGLTLLEREPELAAMGVGSTGQTELGRAAIGEIKVVVPPLRFQNEFSDTVSAIRTLSISLAMATVTLRTTRDLLLPRLLSGEIDVTDLDIAMPGEAA